MTLDDILKKKPWEQRPLLIERVKELEALERPKSPPQRTNSQNAGMHLWFRQIADICQNQGVTMNLVISHTHDVMVTPDAVKGLWKAFMQALYKKKSTTELKKIGEIDTLIDHMVALFAKVEVELPPFPHEDKNVKLKAMENLKNEEYPEHVEPTI